MHTRFHEEHGLAGIVLVLVVAWALAAVFMLTRTLNAAQQIDNRVGFITHYVSPIDKDLDAVKLLEQTNAAAGEIRVSAAPLSGQLAEVQTAAQGINTNVSEILRTAGTINQTAKTINTTVSSIHGTVLAINGNVTQIHRDITDVEVRGHPTLATVRSIDRGVAAINLRADRALPLVHGIKSDTAQILAQVGFPPNAHPNSIHFHARNIDCNLVVGVARILSTVAPLSPRPPETTGNYCPN